MDPAPGRGAALPERRARLLRAEPVGRREAGAARLGDLPLRPRDGPRDRQRRRRDPARDPALRGPADPRRAPGAAVTGLHAAADARPRAARPRLLRRARSTRWSAGTSSTSSASSASRSRCAPSASSSASPRPTRTSTARRTDDAITTDGTPIAFDQSSFDAVLSVLADYVEWRSQQPVRRPHDRAAERRGRRARRHTARRSPATRSSPTPAWSPAPATRPRRASSASRCSCSPSTPTSGGCSSRTRR